MIHRIPRGLGAGGSRCRRDYSFKVCKSNRQKRDGFGGFRSGVPIEYGVYARFFAMRMFRDTHMYILLCGTLDGTSVRGGEREYQGLS